MGLRGQGRGAGAFGSQWADGLSRGVLLGGGWSSSLPRALTPSRGLPWWPHLSPVTSRRPRLLTPALGSGASAYAFGGPRHSAHDERIREKSNTRGRAQRTMLTHVGVSDTSFTLRLGATRVAHHRPPLSQCSRDGENRQGQEPVKLRGQHQATGTRPRTRSRRCEVRGGVQGHTRPGRHRHRR